MYFLRILLLTTITSFSWFVKSFPLHFTTVKWRKNYALRVPFLLNHRNFISTPLPPNKCINCVGGVDDTVKVLINNCYGNFTFSESFYNEYDKTYGTGAAQTFMTTEFYNSLTNKGNIASRYDHKIIELYERLGGSYACSGEYSILSTIEIPRVLIPYIIIDDYNGAEMISICLYKMYRKLLDDILSRRSIRFCDILEYENIRNWERYLNDRNLHFY